jgi:hypothetical protein
MDKQLYFPFKFKALLTSYRPQNVSVPNSPKKTPKQAKTRLKKGWKKQKVTFLEVYASLSTVGHMYKLMYTSYITLGSAYEIYTRLILL